MKMNTSNLKQAALAAALGGASLVSAPAQSTIILLGSDYFETVQPTFFIPLGPLNPLAGLAFGPGSTDTIVRRQADCNLDLFSAGSNCTIPIEMVGLSLVSTVNPMVQLRETPGSVGGTSLSGGTMTMTSDGTGTGGSFISSFFDIFVELSIDGGMNFQPPINAGPLVAGATPWTTIEPLPPALLVPGLMGDPNANRHTDKNCPTGSSTDTCDFYLVGTVQEQHPGVGLHSARPAQVPEPATLALLGIGVAGLGFMRRPKA
jgi:PEP-CTERM motif